MDAAAPEAYSGGMKLLKTYYEQSTANGMALPAATFTTYGSTLTVPCPSATGCFILVESRAQVAGQAASGNVALCLDVDALTWDNCPFVERLPTTGFTMTSHQSGAEVTEGSHVIGTRIYTTVTTQLHHYRTEVKVFKR